MYNVHTKGSLVLTVPCLVKVDKATLKLKLTMILHFDLSDRLTLFYRQKTKQVITVKYY